MSVLRGWSYIQRYGLVNTFLTSSVFVMSAPFPLSDAVATACLVAWVGGRLFWGRWRAERWTAVTWVTLVVVGVRLACLFDGFAKVVDVVLPPSLFYHPNFDIPPEDLRYLVFRRAWQGVVFYTLLRALPALTPMAPLAVPVMFVGAIVLPLSLILFSTATTAVLCYELAKALVVFCFHPTDSNQVLLDFRELARRADASVEETLCLEQRLLVAGKDLDLDDLLHDLRRLDEPWLQLTRLDDDALRELCHGLDFVSHILPVDDPRYADVDAKMLRPAFVYIKTLLNEAYTARPTFTQDATFLGVVYQLVGVLASILPLPLLRHLRRPYRHELLAHFLLTPFLVRYLLDPSRAFFDPSDEIPPSLPGGHFNELVSALPAFLKSAQAAKVRSDRAGQVLGTYLPLVEARRRAQRDEDRAHRAVLDAVLFWKGRKEEKRSRVVEGMKRE
ncbi:hypothetical protein JCM6882_008816 [Rhodosporidiobolus microsporus]